MKKIKYEDHLSSNFVREWKDAYLDYSKCMKQIKGIEVAVETKTPGSDPTVLEADFAATLAVELAKIKDFVYERVEELKNDVLAGKADEKESARKFRKLEKFVNINILGMDVLLKMHDNLVPSMKSRADHLDMITRIDWIRYDMPAQVMQLLPNLLSWQTDDIVKRPARKSNIHWVRNDDVPRIERVIQLNMETSTLERRKGLQGTIRAGSNHFNNVYLDNAQYEMYNRWLNNAPGAVIVRMSWFSTAPPEAVVIELLNRNSRRVQRFQLASSKVGAFLAGTYTFKDKKVELKGAGVTYKNQIKVKRAFERTQMLVRTKQLRPSIQVSFTRSMYHSKGFKLYLDQNFQLARVDPAGDVVNGFGWSMSPAQLVKAAAGNLGYEAPSSGQKPAGGAMSRLNPIGTLRRTLFKPIAPVTHEVAAPTTKGFAIGHAVLVLRSSGKDFEPPAWLATLLRSDRMKQVEGWTPYLSGCARLCPQEVTMSPEWANQAFPPPEQPKAMLSSRMGIGGIGGIGRIASQSFRQSVSFVSLRNIRNTKDTGDLSKSLTSNAYPPQQGFVESSLTR